MPRPDFTPPIQFLDAGERAVVVDRVCSALERRYGLPRHGNPADPLDDLIYIILSNRTHIGRALEILAAVKARFPQWDDVLIAPEGDLRDLLRPAGLASKKSRQIVGLLGKIAADFGACRLDALRAWNEATVQAYLCGLSGVSEKVAKCVMAYTLGFAVLPVDVNVHRVATRLGWTVRKRADQCHEGLEALVPPAHRYGFHVDCVSHGQAVCKANRPLCQACPVSGDCNYYKVRNADCQRTDVR